MKKLTLLLATITLATIVLALPAVPLRADGCGGSGGGGGILSITSSPIFDNNLGGDCNTAPEPNSFVLLSVGIGALGLILFLRELKASKAAGGQASRS
jgi:hypothetical protein